MQGRSDCLLVGSGVATIAATLLALCKQGDHVLGFIESYGPTRYLVQHLLAKYGVTHTLLSIEDLAGIERVLHDTRTRLAIFESPTNPVTKIADLDPLIAHAKRAGCLTVMDNTFAGFHNHGAYDIDVFVHSLTKYASGHGDVMGGAIIAHAALIDQIRKDVVMMGPTLDHMPRFNSAGHAHLLSALRAGMRECARGESLSERSSARQTGLSSRPQEPSAACTRETADEGFWQRREFELDGRIRGGQSFSRRRSSYFPITSSVGSTESLVMPPQLLGGQEFTAAQREASLIGRGTVRLSIGIEEAADLIADLAQALDEAFV